MKTVSLRSRREQVAGKRRQLNMVAVVMSRMLGKQAVANLLQSSNVVTDKYSSSS